ncbi:MAG TPA: glycosyltransferase family 4 protein [Stellaceae bacterium]|nr:glycosyltransferase family 4 protein [Stellaceae bacterium]
MSANQRYAPDAGGGPASRRLRLLTFTTLYPNAAMPVHGIFVENRLRHLVAGGNAESRVVAPVPWFPSTQPRFGRYAHFAAVPRDETRHGIEIVHPRYPLLPRIGMSLAPLLLYRATLPVLRRLQVERDFDVIDAHYFYPDGVAAVLLGRALGKPVVITARGSDVNQIPRHLLPRRMLCWAAERAAAIVTVAEALKTALVGLGVAPEKIVTLRNGVDLALFRPLDRDAARISLLVSGRVLLSVGHLIERKGHHHVIAALPRLPETTLLIAGTGPEHGRLDTLARELGVAGRVRFLGAVAHEDLPRLYGAADALILASSREGIANVLYEAMACGTPVVASRAWGNPEIVADPAAGVLMDELSAAGVAAAVARLFQAPPSRAATRRYAEGFGWAVTTAGLTHLFNDIVAAANAATTIA